jgi:hypothetical protein
LQLSLKELGHYKNIMIMKLFQFAKTKRFNNFSLILFSTLSGFLLANLFGTFLNALRYYVVWDGFIIGTLIFFVEATNVIVYRIPIRLISREELIEPRDKRRVLGLSDKERSFTLLKGFRVARFHFLPFLLNSLSLNWRNISNEELVLEPRFPLYRLINSFKLGLLLGFFVEAFKVGS